MRASEPDRTIDLSIVERNVRIRCPDRRLCEWVRQIYRVMEAPLEDAGLIDLEIVIELSRDGGEYRIQRPREGPIRAAEAGECLVLLEDALAIELQLLRRDLFFVHAATLQQEDGVLLFSGESGSGKSSLAWALTRRGFKYFSDELAPLDIEGIRVWPFPRALHLKADPPPPNALPATVLDTGEAYCIPPECLPGGTATLPAPISAIFFLQRPPAASRPEVRELTPAQSVARLAANTLNLLAHPHYGVDHATEVVRNVRCFELGAADLEATCDLIESTLATSRSPSAL